MREEIKKSITFIILVLIISYLFGFSVIFLKNRIVFPQNFFTIFPIIYMYIPIFIVLIVEKYIFHESLKGFGRYFKFNIYILLAIVIPIILIFLSLFSSLIFKDTNLNLNYFKPDYILLLIFQGIIIGSTINALVALGEEFGWRGYLLKNLMHLGFYKSSLIIGFVWGIWHAPVILLGLNYPDHRFLGVFMMIIFCILLTPIMVYLTLKSKSIITPSIFHGVLNAFGGLHLILLIGGSDLTIGITGLAGFIVLIIFNIFLIPIFNKLNKELIAT